MAYEDITYEWLLKQMLAVALAKNPDIDTRETSPVWYGIAPAAVEMQNIYIELDQILNETFADTASREPLIKRAKERGLQPRPATKMLGKGEFTPSNINIAIGSRFSLNDLNYVITSKIEDGVYQVQCETAGEIGNEYIGTLIPIEYVEGLETAQLTEILIPGEDDEATEAFRQRYFNSLDAQAFGGNVADYVEKVNAISGVGGVKVRRAWNGDIQPALLVPPVAFPAWFEGLGEETPMEIKEWLLAVATAAQDGLLTVGGTIRLVIIDSTYSKPSELLVETVQTMIDPTENHAEGLGLAPIGHFVTVQPVGTSTVNVGFAITYQNDWVWDDVRPYAEAAVDDYFKELAESWEQSTDPLVVRISQLETRILTCPGVVDVTDTTINGASANLVLDDDNIPVRGAISG